MPPATRRRLDDGSQRYRNGAVGVLLIDANKRVCRPFRTERTAPSPLSPNQQAITAVIRPITGGHSTGLSYDYMGTTHFFSQSFLNF